MPYNPLVLSLFPGIGLLDMAFELEGFTVVRGPDVLWGGDIRTFHPPAGKFDGVIGGPPCQTFSSLARLVRANGHEPTFGNLIPEYERCVVEAQPAWFLMENVGRAPTPDVAGFNVTSQILDSRDFQSPQTRKRLISFGSRNRTLLLVAATGRFLFSEPAVTARTGGRRAVAVRDKSGRLRGGKGDSDWQRQGWTLPQMAVLQGLPPKFLEHAPFTESGKKKMVANGVPLPMGRAIARAVREAVTT